MKWISFSDGLRVVSICTLLASCSPEKYSATSQTMDESKLSANVIYGTDGRLDYYQVTDDRLKAIADSTVALIKTSDLKSAGNVVSIVGKNYGTTMGLCPTEKFSEQDTAAFCSGSLVGPDTVLTAGHCIEQLSDCTSTSLVFGFTVKAQGVSPKTVSASEVYRCKEIIKTMRDNNGADFAVIKLDRAVSNHAVLSVRPTGDVDMSASLVVIGHPVGLPTKITTGGTVRSLASAGYFQANVDTFGGNSGSGVFNRDTGLIEGVLVRGEEDFESRGGCVVSKVCAEGACRGEDITRISSVRPYMTSASAGSAPPVTVPTTPAVGTETFTSNQRADIPDNNAAGVSTEIKVGSVPRGRKVFFAVNITHPYIGDLVIKVAAPDGKSVTLQQRAGGSAQNMNKSFEVTSSFGGLAVAGSYKILVQDLAVRDAGTLTGWAIQFR